MMILTDWRPLGSHQFCTIYGVTVVGVLAKLANCVANVAGSSCDASLPAVLVCSICPLSLDTAYAAGVGNGRTDNARIRSTEKSQQSPDCDARVTYSGFRGQHASSVSFTELHFAMVVLCVNGASMVLKSCIWANNEQRIGKGRLSIQTR